MKDAVVSVRIPSSLVVELKNLAKENHYVDLSEQIREIIRQKLMQFESEEQSKSTTHDKKEASKKTAPKDKEVLLAQLQSLIEELKKEI